MVLFTCGMDLLEVTALLDGCQRAADSVWISDEGSSEGEESGGGVGGLDGGCMSLLGLLTC